MRWLPWAFAFYFVTSLFSMAAMSIGVGVLALGLLVALGGPRGLWAALREEARAPEVRRYLWLSAALAGACVASLLYAKVAPLSYGGRSAEIHFFGEVGKLWYFVLPLFLLVGLRRMGEAGQAVALRAWLGAFAVLSLIGIDQYFTGWPRMQVIPFTANYAHPRYHATLFLGHHLSVASIWIFPLFATLELMLKPQAARRLRIPGPGLALIALLGGVTLFLGYSRMLWIALPIGFIAWALWRLPPKGRVAVLAVLALGSVALTQVPVIKSRILDPGGITDRTNLWRINLEFLRERPLFGVGWRHNHELSGIYQQYLLPGQDVFAGHAHNNVIDMLGGLGLVGLLAWFAWCGGIFRLFWRTRHERSAFNFGMGLFCAWIVFHLNGLTQVNFWEAKVQHQGMIAVAWALLYQGRALGQKDAPGR